MCLTRRPLVTVLALRESATALGLMRKSSGRLFPTAAGRRLLDDPRGLLRHVGSRVPLGRPHERDAGIIALLQAAVGTPPDDRRQELAELLRREPAKTSP